jgi:hypothetical protein
MSFWCQREGRQLISDEQGKRRTRHGGNGDRAVVLERTGSGGKDRLALSGLLLRWTRHDDGSLSPSHCLSFATETNTRKKGNGNGHGTHRKSEARVDGRAGGRRARELVSRSTAQGGWCFEGLKADEVCCPFPLACWCAIRMLNRLSLLLRVDERCLAGDGSSAEEPAGGEWSCLRSKAGWEG